jgi:hypothetical protein
MWKISPRSRRKAKKSEEKRSQKKGESYEPSHAETVVYFSVEENRGN